MPLTTGERSLHKVARGVEVTHGTRVDPTVYLNMKSTGIIDLDRAFGHEQEDYGHIAAHEANRDTLGVRLAKLPLRGVARFEDITEVLAPSMTGGVVATGPVDSAYLWVYAADLIADAVNSYTIQEGDNLEAYEMRYSVMDRLRLSFNALTAPVNAPWNVEADFIGQDKVPTAFTGTPTTVASAETMMGHLTTAAIGPVATAFAALPNLVGLHQFDLTIPTGITPRKWGDNLDVFNTHGRLNRTPTFTATFFSTAATKTGLFDIFNTAGAAPVDQRLRIAVTGSLLGVSAKKQFYIDGRIRFTAVPVLESLGATVYAATGVYVVDATLASDIEFTVQNGIATVA